MTRGQNSMLLTNTLLNGNDGTNLGALPNVRITLTETKLPLWVLALSCCIDALTAQLDGCDIKIRLTQHLYIVLDYDTVWSWLIVTNFEITCSLHLP